MPMTSFQDEFSLRYIKDEPIIRHRGRPFFPNSIHFEDGRYIIGGRYITPKGNKVSRAIDLDEHELDLSFPEPGWLNVGPDHIFYFSLKNLQQYRFALTHKNAKLYDPHKGADVGAYHNVWRNCPEAKATAEAIFCRSYYTVKKAYQLTALNTSHVGAAFSKDLAFLLWPGYSVPLVAYRGKPIAIAESSEKVAVFSHLSCMKEILNEYFPEVEVV